MSARCPACGLDMARITSHRGARLPSGEHERILCLRAGAAGRGQVLVGPVRASGNLGPSVAAADLRGAARARGYCTGCAGAAVAPAAPVGPTCGLCQGSGSSGWARAVRCGECGGTGRARA